MTGNPMPKHITDAWCWRAHYRDGSYFDEYDSDYERGTGHDHGFAEIDQTMLAALELVPSPHRPELPNHILLINISNGQRPIFFRRHMRFLPMNAAGELADTPQGEPLTATILGWQRTIRGRNQAHFNVYFDDGSSFATDDRDTLDKRLSLIAQVRFR